MATSITKALEQSQTANLVRIAIGFLFALAVTLSLFWLMQYLIATADRSLNEDGAGNLVDFVRVKRDEAIQRLMNDARRMEADAVVNVRIATSMVMQGASEILAYGTAVKFKD